MAHEIVSLMNRRIATGIGWLGLEKAAAVAAAQDRERGRRRAKHLDAGNLRGGAGEGPRRKVRRQGRALGEPPGDLARLARQSPARRRRPPASPLVSHQAAGGAWVHSEALRNKTGEPPSLGFQPGQARCLKRQL